MQEKWSGEDSSVGGDEDGWRHGTAQVAATTVEWIAGTVKAVSIGSTAELRTSGLDSDSDGAESGSIQFCGAAVMPVQGMAAWLPA